MNATKKDTIIYKYEQLSNFKDSLLIDSYNQIDQFKVDLNIEQEKSEKRLKWILRSSFIGVVVGILGVLFI